MQQAITEKDRQGFISHGQKDRNRQLQKIQWLQ
jgi:hypothetical protein